MDSVKRKKFKIAIEKASTKFSKSLRSIAKLSNKRNYEYTDDDVKKIFKVLMKEMQYTYDCFHNKRDLFKLD